MEQVENPAGPIDSGRYAGRAGPWAGGRLDIEGHRGARGLVPENTVPSFRAAVEAGVTGVELDVQLTADGEVVVWHDPTLQADKCVFDGADLTGAWVGELTLAQLRTVDVGRRTLPAYPRQRPVPGTRMVTLAELLAEFADATDLWWTIEVKTDATDPREVATRHTLTERVVAAIHDAGIQGRCFVHSFDWATLEAAEALDPALLRSALAVVGNTYVSDSAWLGSVRYADFGPDLAAAAASIGATVVAPHHSTCDAAFVERAHALGLAVMTWTVNEPADLHRLRAAGVDSIVTDVPDLAVSLLFAGGS